MSKGIGIYIVAILVIMVIGGLLGALVEPLWLAITLSGAQGFLIMYYAQKWAIKKYNTRLL